MRRIVLAIAAAAAAGSLAVGVGRAASPPTQSGYIPIQPCRAIDTRPGEFHTGNLSTLTSASTNTAHLTSCGVPSNASAVFVNATALNASQATFVTLWGIGARPGTSTLNPTPGTPPSPNGVIVPVSAGAIRVYNYAGTVDLILDVAGYYAELPGAPGATPNPTPTPNVGPKIDVRITGYGPAGTITSVTGDVTNNGAESLDLRIDVTCPNDTVKIDYVFDLNPGSTIGWSVLCDEAFTDGATATWVEI